MKILLLEDNTTDADLTKRELTASFPHCTVEVAPTLKQARELLAGKAPFDIAILDMKLPDGTGMELLMEIRQSETNLPVIILTGSGNEEVAIAALKSGANDYLVKKQGYLSKLPGAIEFTINNHKQTIKLSSEIIEVLYIEHHAADIDLTKRHLSQYAPNIHLSVVSTAEAALQKLHHGEGEPVDCQVILIDYLLPGLNALEFIKIVRQERKLTIPIILITGHGNEEVAIESLKMGANEYLEKRENYLYRIPSLITSVYQQCELIKKQAALVASEAKYRLLAENSGDVIFVLDKEMKYTYVSPAIKGLRGYEVEEVINHTLQQVLTPDSYLLAMEAISEFFPGSSVPQDNIEIEKTVELEMTCKDGSTVWTEVKGKLIRDEHGLPSGIIGVTRDISKRKKATSELRKLSRAVEQSSNSIVITAIDGTIEYANPVTFKLTGYSAEELIGNSPRIFSSGETAKEEYELLWKTILAGKDWEGEFHNKRKNGELFWEQASISPIFDEKGKIIHFLAIKKDITESKKQTEELIIAKEHAEESDRLKSAFLANMSHEIRTPLNSIIGFSELLGDDFFEPEQKREFTQNIIVNGNNLLTIINDIIEISKIEAGQLTIKKSKVQVKQFLDDIRKQNIIAVENKGLSLKNSCQCDDPGSEVFVYTDQDRLQQIFNNLIGNALKFTREGYIEIGCKIFTHEIVFFIKDTGIGIPSEFHTVIFDRFRQVEDEKTRKYGGNGLGLAITKNLVELMGGKVWLESEVGKGTTFYLSLPTK